MLTGCVTLGKSFYFSEFQFSHLKKKLILPSKVFKGLRNQMTDVCERALRSVEDNKNICDYYDARLGR